MPVTYSTAANAEIQYPLAFTFRDAATSIKPRLSRHWLGGYTSL